MMKGNIVRLLLWSVVAVSLVAVRANAGKLKDCVVDKTFEGSVTGSVDPVRLVLQQQVAIVAGGASQADDPATITCTLDKKGLATEDQCPDLFDPIKLQAGSIGVGSVCAFRNVQGFVATQPPNSDVKTTLSIDDKGAVDVTALGLEDGTRVLVVDAAERGKPLVEVEKVISNKVVLKSKDIKGSDKTTAYWLSGAKLATAKVSSVQPLAQNENTVAAGELALDNPAVIKGCDLAFEASHTRDYNVLCFVADSRRVTQFAPPSDGPVMRPNRSIMVTVVHVRDTQISVSVDGDAGVAIPGILDMSGEKANEVVTHAATDPHAPVPLVDTQTFGPRKPGKANVHVKGKGDKPPEIVTELLVETTYSGALRVGVGGVFGGAVDRGYTAQMHPGSGQSEIVASNVGDMDLEVIIGAAIFLDKGGRGYAVPGHDMRWAPYLGLGVVNQTESGLKLLRSVHLGIEYELNPHFSVALTGVARKITQLGKGLAVGGPVSTSVPTDTGVEFGFGIVINFSPDFLRLATKSGSSFFGN